MAKKTVIKKVLKYAPLKSEFSRAISQDGTIKNDISDDMSLISDDYIETDYVDVDTETGEVLEKTETEGEANA